MSKKKEENVKEKKVSRLRRLPRTVKLILLLVAVIAIAAAGFAIRRWTRTSHKREFTIDEIQITVKETIAASRMNFAEVPYRGVVEWKDGNLLVGYIAYSGKVTYSMDFSQITVKADEKSNTLFVLLPEIEQSYSLDRGKVECIFSSLPVRLKYNDASLYQSTEWNLCETDMKYEVTKQPEPMTQAMAFAREYITSLVKPFLEGTDIVLYVNYGGMD